MTSPINGPIPPYNNPPIEPQFYQPSQFFIESITLGPTTIVTTTVNNNYVIGQLVRLLIPSGFGAVQFNGQQAYVISLPAANQVELNIFSVYYDALVSSTGTTLPQILAIGDINSGQTNANGIMQSLTFIPGSFINISPA